VASIHQINDLAEFPNVLGALGRRNRGDGQEGTRVSLFDTSGGLRHVLCIGDTIDGRRAVGG
jgi:hypothetical protein